MKLIKNYSKMLLMALTLSSASIVMASKSTAQVSQTPAKRTDKIISSGVIKIEDGDILPFSTITIKTIGLAKDKSYSQVTDAKANFRIQVVKAPKYSIEVKFVGMKTKKFEVKDAKKLANLTIVLKEDNKALGEVVVTKTRKLVKVDIDKLSYDTQSDPESKSKSVFEMLRKVPLVTITGQDEIQIKGSNDYAIFLNGKPTKAFGNKPQDVLKTIPSSSIKKIEIITDPGVKYSAEGTSNIINIVTESKTESVGYNGSVSLGYVLPYPNSSSKINGTLNLGLARKNWGLSTRYTSHNRWGRMNRFISTRYLTSTDSINDNSYVDGKNRSHNFNINGYYNITDKDLITTNLYGYIDNENLNSSSKQIHKSRENNTLLNTLGNSYHYSLSLDYQHSLDKKGGFFTLSYLLDYNKDNSSKYLRDDKNKLILKNDPDNALYRENTIQADLTLPFLKVHKIETGVKYINRYNYSFLNEMLANSTNTYNYTYNIAAVYASYSSMLGSFSLKTGARGELTYINFQNNNKDIKLSPRFDWIPNLSIAYNITPMSIIKINYHFNIRRPSIWQLNPNYQYNSQTFIRIGNPNLKSEKKNTISLDYSLYSQSIALNLSAGYTFYTDKIQQVFIQDPTKNNAIVQTYNNFGNVHAFSGNLYFAYNGLNWLRPHIYASYNTTKYPTVKEYRNSYGFGLGSQVFLPYEFTLGYSVGIFKQAIDDNTDLKMGYYNNISLNKTFLNRKINLGISMNLMPKYLEIVTLNKKAASYRGKIESFNSYISLSLSYNFGEMKTRMKKVNNSINNTDKVGQSSGLGL